MTYFLPLLPMLLATQPVLEDINALDARLAELSGGTATPLDRRLKLARCQIPPSIQPAAQSGIDLSCPSRGWRLRVPTLTASANAVSNSAQPVLVQRGESVQVAIVGDDFAVHYQAIAIESGRMGDVVRVKFAGANRILASTVSGHGKVRILD